MAWRRLLTTARHKDESGMIEGLGRAASLNKWEMYLVLMIKHLHVINKMLL